MTASTTRRPVRTAAHPDASAQTLDLTNSASGRAEGADATETDASVRRRRVLALALLVSAQFVVMLDTSIVNVALPTIKSSLALSVGSLSWVVNAYVLTFGGLLLLCGRVADQVGRRRVFTLGSALFTVGTLVAAGAPSEWVLITGRVVQGAGAACLSPAAMALLLVNFPGKHRARAMSLWGAASTLGGATGVAVGGLLAGSVGWPSVFLVTVPVSVVSVVMAGRLLDDSQKRAVRNFDLPGAATITAAVVALVHGSLNLAAGNWAEFAIVGVAIPTALIALFIRAESQATDPLVPLDLFQSRRLPTGVALAVLGGAARASTFVLVALYLQMALAMSPEAGGLAMVPTSVTGFVVSLALLPRVLRRFGPHWSLVAGLVVLAVGHLWLAFAPAGSGYALGVLPGLFLVATGVALSFTPTTMVIASAVDESHAGLASGLASSATQVGAAIGTAAFTAIALRDSSSGFPAAFTVAAVIALGTALLGSTLARSPRS